MCIYIYIIPTPAPPPQTKKRKRMRAWGFLPPVGFLSGGGILTFNIYAKVQAYRGRVWGGSHRGEEYQLAATLVQVQSYGGVEFHIFPAPKHHFPRAYSADIPFCAAPTVPKHIFVRRLRRRLVICCCATLQKHMFTEAYQSINFSDVCSAHFFLFPAP